MWICYRYFEFLTKRPPFLQCAINIVRYLFLCLDGRHLAFLLLAHLEKYKKKSGPFFLRNRLKKRRIASCWKFVILPDSRATNEIQPCLLVLFNDFLVFFIKSLAPEKLFVYFAFCGNKNIIKLCFAGIKPIKLIINRL